MRVQKITSKRRLDLNNILIFFLLVSEEIQFRLTGGRSSDEGHLEINYGGTWGRICGSGFGTSEALVACRHIGYSSVSNLQVQAK